MVTLCYEIGRRCTHTGDVTARVRVSRRRFQRRTCDFAAGLQGRRDVTPLCKPLKSIVITDGRYQMSRFDLEDALLDD